MPSSEREPSERKPSTSESKSAANRSGKKSATGSRDSRPDAVALLQADHQRVAAWFEEYEIASSLRDKRDLAQRICTALTVHATIEEEIFYPAFLEATGETDVHHEAEVEHQGAKVLIAEIEGSDPKDEYFDSKVKVLAELIQHHVGEEEQGMFAKARASEMDMASLGRQLQARKDEIDAPASRRAG